MARMMRSPRPIPDDVDNEPDERWAHYNDEHPPAADNVSGADNVRVAIAATDEMSARVDDPADDPRVQEESS